MSFFVQFLCSWLWTVLIFRDPCYFGLFHLLSFPQQIQMCFNEIKYPIKLHLIFLAHVHCSLIVPSFMNCSFKDSASVCSWALWISLLLFELFLLWFQTIVPSLSAGDPINNWRQIRVCCGQWKASGKTAFTSSDSGPCRAPSLLRAEMKHFGTISGVVYWIPCHKTVSENKS